MRPKIMVLSVTGVAEPFKRLVSVDDEEEFLGTMRMSVVKDTLENTPVLNTALTTEGMVFEALSKIKIKLIDTGLKEYPSTAEEVEEILNGGVLV